MADVFLEYHHFEPLVGNKVTFSGVPLGDMTLLKVIKSQKFMAEAKRDPFILIFRSPRLEYFMLEGMRECAFEGGPTYNLYVAPTHTAEKEWQDYQSIFS
jgi:hypothetical protein